MRCTESTDIAALYGKALGGSSQSRGNGSAMTAGLKALRAREEGNGDIKIFHGVKPFILSYRYVCTELTEVAILFGSLRVWFKSWATGVKTMYTTKHQCIGGAYKHTVS